MSLVKKNFFYNNFINITNLVIPFLIFPYISRVLGPEKLGVVSFIVSLVSTFVIIASLGLPIYGIREIAKCKNDKKALSKTFSELIIIQLVSFILTALIYFCWLSFSKTLETQNLIKFLSLIHLFSLVSLLHWFFQGIENYKVIWFTNMLTKISLGCLVFLVVNKTENYVEYYAIIVITLLISALINIYIALKKVSFVTKNLNFKKHFKSLIYLFTVQIAIGIYINFDILFLGYLSTNLEVGYYTPANKIIKLSLLFITSLGLVLIPKIARFIKEEKINLANRVVTKSLNFVMLIAFPTIVILFFLSEEIIILFAGNQYIKSVVLLKYSTPLVFFIGLSNIFGLQILTPYNKEKQLMLAVVIGALCSIFLNIILIPKYNSLGAVYALLITEAIITFITFYFVKKNKLVSFKFSIIIKYLCLASLLIPVFILLKAYFEGMLYLFLSLFTYCVFYFGLLYMLKDKFFIQEIISPILKKVK